MATPDPEFSVYDQAARDAVELANRIAEQEPDADLWDVASGVLAGAVHYWLYTRQPCGDPACEDCDDISTAEQRLKVLAEEVREAAEGSDYFHSPQDTNVGTA